MNLDYKVMEWIQSIGGAEGSLWNNVMDFFFASVTFLGEEIFLLLGIFILYWALNKRLGEYLVIALFATVGINSMFKSIVARPRPFLNPEYSTLRHLEIDNFFVNSSSAELSHSYSFPSGHSQLAGSLFTTVALFFKKRVLSIIMGILIVLMMLSRVYLGVHYPSDVLIGGLLGIVVAMTMFYIIKKFEDKKIVILLILFCLVVITFIYELITKSSSAANTAKMVGLAGGAIIGFIIESKKINFVVDGIWWKRTLRVIVGFVIVMAVRLGLKLIFELIDGDSTVMIMIFDAIRYGCMGLTATALWPYIFMKIKL